MLGLILLKQDKTKEAIQSFRRGVELNPYDETYHTSYGIVLKMDGDCTGADTQFAEAIALNPSDAVAHRQMLACQPSLTPINNPSTNFPQFMILLLQDRLVKFIVKMQISYEKR